MICENCKPAVQPMVLMPPAREGSTVDQPYKAHHYWECPRCSETVKAFTQDSPEENEG